MEIAEYYNLNLQLVASYNAAFEYWLTVTFAFLAAVFFAYEKISLAFRRLVLTIYGFSAALFIFRFAMGVQSVSRLLDDMGSNGIPDPPYAVDPWQGQIIIWGMFLLMTFGSIASTYFGYNRRENGT